MKKIHSFLCVMCLLLSACGSITSTPTVEITETSTPTIELTPIDLQTGYGVKGSWFELYFTDPVDPFSSQGTGGVDGPLVEAINSARLSIDVAAYSLSLNSVRNALLNARDRGVTVRMVMESTNMDRSDVEILLEAGIPIVGDKQDGLMHDKFMVIDKSEVWLGSMNFTDSGAYDDDNHLMRIRSTKMAENYSKEFDEMFLDNRFGENTTPETPHPTLTIDSTRVDTFFSPDDGVASQIATVLSGAEESIYFLAFSFTSNDLGDIVREKAEDGLTVKGVMDEEQVSSNQGTEYDPFKQADLDVRIDGIEGQMHHKVFIIDGSIVVIGSYNFSQAAETRNDENTLIIYNEAIAQQFMLEFERVWKVAHD
ncbi:MAG TPA: phospholipase D-like domain-containing protein [Anaerolineales bacterium]|jgi:phosphatidylserine/phosphatidylglycerophosphate/cardiolipin synthase-like enzyme|nr:phospholipase D-like domain-containing protein [Anaerolineales bacterium]HQX16107.1 phospholipase D-like domain-containing protein [Anaerolineales bacterium]